MVISQNLVGGAAPAAPIDYNRVAASGGIGRFTKLRRAVFPIYGGHEVTKFLLIGSIKFFIILALTLTRDTKGKVNAQGP
jgi:AAA family ATP:ADP antiporter